MTQSAIPARFAKASARRTKTGMTSSHLTIMSQEFQFDPKNLKLENIQSDRPTIGDDVSVVLWRLVRVIGLHSILEEETPMVIYFAGKQIGKMLGAKNVEEIKEKLVQLKIGTIDFPVNQF